MQPAELILSVTDVWMMYLCCETFFKPLLILQFLSDSYESWHTHYLCATTKKNYGTDFWKFCCKKHVHKFLKFYVGPPLVFKLLDIIRTVWTGSGFVTHIIISVLFVVYSTSFRQMNVYIISLSAYSPGAYCNGLLYFTCSLFWFNFCLGFSVCCHSHSVVVVLLLTGASHITTHLL